MTHWVILSTQLLTRNQNFPNISADTRSRPDRDFRNRTGPDRIGTPDPVDRTGPDRIPDQDIDFFENFVVFFPIFLVSNF